MGLGDVHTSQQPGRAGLPGGGHRSPSFLVEPDRLHQLVPDSEGRGPRLANGSWKTMRDRPARGGGVMRLGYARRAGPSPSNSTRPLAGRVARQQAEDGAQRRRLAAAGFADQAERFAGGAPSNETLVDHAQRRRAACGSRRRRRRTSRSCGGRVAAAAVASVPAAAAAAPSGAPPKVPGALAALIRASAGRRGRRPSMASPMPVITTARPGTVASRRSRREELLPVEDHAAPGPGVGGGTPRPEVAESHDGQDVRARCRTWRRRSPA